MFSLFKKSRPAPEPDLLTKIERALGGVFGGTGQRLFDADEALFYKLFPGAKDSEMRKFYLSCGLNVSLSALRYKRSKKNIENQRQEMAGNRLRRWQLWARLKERKRRGERLLRFVNFFCLWRCP